MSMKSPELVVLAPVLARPHRVKPLIESLARATRVPHRLVFIANPEDEPEQQAIADAGAEMFIVDGNYAHKINAGIRGTQEPLIFLGADDLDFKPGWFEKAKDKLAEGIGVVGTNDLCNRRTMRGRHSTHSLVARWYVSQGTIDEPDRLLHEGYRHEYCDDELVETAKARGAYAHARNSFVEHLHPLVGKAPDDATYQLGRSGTHLSKQLFSRRQRLWQTPQS